MVNFGLHGVASPLNVLVDSLFALRLDDLAQVLLAKIVYQDRFVFFLLVFSTLEIELLQVFAPCIGLDMLLKIFKNLEFSLTLAS